MRTTVMERENLLLCTLFQVRPSLPILVFKFSPDKFTALCSTMSSLPISFAFIILSTILSILSIILILINAAAVNQLPPTATSSFTFVSPSA